MVLCLSGQNVVMQKHGMPECQELRVDLLISFVLRCVLHWRNYGNSTVVE